MIRGPQLAGRARDHIDWPLFVVSATIAVLGVIMLVLFGFIGGYLLVKEGRVELSGGHARFGMLDGPTKIAVGGGDIELIADTDVVFAPGTIRTRLGIVIDTDAGYQTELWEILGGNIRATHAVGYRR